MSIQTTEDQLLWTAAVSNHTNKMQHKYKQNVIINKRQSVKVNTNTATENRLMLEHQLWSTAAAFKQGLTVDKSTHTLQFKSTTT